MDYVQSVPQDDCAVTKFFHVKKKYSAMKILNQCPTKGWFQFGIEYLIKKIDKLALLNSDKVSLRSV